MKRFLCAAAVLSVGFPAAALTVDDAVASWRDAVATCSEALDELAYQADMARSDSDAVLAGLGVFAEAIGRGEADLAAYHAAERARADIAAEAAPRLAAPGAEGAHVPRIGWGIFGWFEQRREETNAAIREVETGVADGIVQFGVAGIGSMSRQDLSGMADRLTAGRAALDAAIEGGSFVIDYPGLGLVSRIDLEACIAANEAEISATLAIIAAGDYAVALPHFGPVTRNQLEAMTAETEAQIAALIAARDAGALMVTRPIHPVALSGADNDAMAAAVEADAAALAAALAEGRFEVGLPFVGPVSRETIAQTLASLAEAVATVQAAVAEGTYSISADGFPTIDAATAEELLGRPDCRSDTTVACLEPDLRPILREVLFRVPAAAAVEVALLAVETALWEGYVAVLDAHAAPAAEAIALRRRRVELVAAEFDRELAAYQAQLTRRLDQIARARDLMP